MITHGKNIKIFTGNSNPNLAKDIARYIRSISWRFKGWYF